VSVQDPLSVACSECLREGARGRSAATVYYSPPAATTQNRECKEREAASHRKERSQARIGASTLCTWEGVEGWQRPRQIIRVHYRRGLANPHPRSLGEPGRTRRPPGFRVGWTRKYPAGHSLSATPSPATLFAISVPSLPHLSIGAHYALPLRPPVPFQIPDQKPNAGPISRLCDNFPSCLGERHAQYRHSPFPTSFRGLKGRCILHPLLRPPPFDYPSPRRRGRDSEKQSTGDTTADGTRPAVPTTEPST